MPIPGILIAAGLGAAASAANGIASSISTSNANSANREIADANNRTAILINEANIRAQQEALAQQNQFNHDEAVLANSRELQKTFLLNRLNSPAAIAERYREAGMNPAVMMSGQSTIGASSSSAPQASAASSGISTGIPNLNSPTMQPVPSIAGGILNSVESMARAYKDLNSGNREGAEADTIRGQLEARIREAFANAGIAEMNEEFTTVFGPSLQSAKLRESVAAAAVDFAHATELAKQGNVHDSQVKLNETIASLNKAKEKLTGEEAKLYGKQIEWFDDTSNAKIKELLASASRNSAEAQTINALRVDEVRLKKAEADYQSYNAGIALHTLQNQPLVKARLVRELISLTEDITAKRLSNEQESILTARYNELLEQDIQKGEKELRQMGQDYWNPFRYVGTLLGGGVASGMGKELIKPK